MKRLYTLLAASAIASVSFAQSKVMQDAVKVTEKTRYTNIETSEDVYLDRGAAFYTNEFDVPSDWLIQNAVDIGVDGFVDLQWEIGVGLENEGFFPTGTIESTTVDNGIAMVDSDEYGGEEGGDGIENCWIQTVNPINCEDFPNVAITFQNQYRYYAPSDDACLLEISTDGVTWPDVTTFGEGDEEIPGTRFEIWPRDLGGGEASDNPETVYVDISEAAGGQSTVYLRFRWKGTWGYTWMIDDLAMQVVPDNSLRFTDVTYMDPNSGIDPYGTYTPEQQASLQFRGDFENNGLLEQTGVSMTVSVNDVEWGTTDETTIAPGVADSLLFTETYDVPTEPGIYNVMYELNLDNEDFDPSDNVEMETFQVDQWQYGRDQDGIAFIQPAADFADGEWRAGPFMDIWEDGTVYAIDVALWDWDGFESGGTMAGYLMDPAADGIDNEDVFEFAEEIEVPAWNLNTIDDEGNLKWTTMVLEEPYAVFAGDVIHATVGGFNTDFRIVGEETTVPLGGVTYESGTWTNFVNVNWAVRLNFNPDAATSVDEVASESFAVGQNFPNPAVGNTRIPFDLEVAGTVNFEVYDVAGKLVMNDFQGTLPAGNHVIDIDTADFPAGVYQYSVIVDGERITRPMMVK